MPLSVIPANSMIGHAPGIQRSKYSESFYFKQILNSRFRGNDKAGLLEFQNDPLLGSLLPALHVYSKV